MKPEFRFDTSHIEWMHLEGGPEVDYPMDYWMAVLGSQAEVGSLDMLIRFAPNSYCHFHRHVAATTTLVLEGEQHIYEVDSSGETIHRVRRAGDYARSAGGDVHMEAGGPDGGLVFFGLQSVDGRLFDLLDPERNIVASTTIEELAGTRSAAQVRG